MLKHEKLIWIAIFAATPMMALGAQFHSGSSAPEVCQPTVEKRLGEISAHPDTFTDGELLNRAAEIGRKDAIKVLIERGADVDARDSDGDTALMKAAVTGRDEIVVLLLANGADINARDPYGWTPLTILAGTDPKAKTVNLLLDHKADINATDNQGLTPLMVASWVGNDEVIALLLARGTNVNARDNEGNTALIMASRDDAKGTKKTIELLVKGGVDINAKNKDGVSAIETASTAGKKDIVELLRAHGANL